MILDRCIKIYPDLVLLRDNCEILSGFYIETRYPPDIPDYTKTDIINAVSQAEQIKTVIEKLTKK